MIESEQRRREKKQDDKKKEKKQQELESINAYTVELGGQWQKYDLKVKSRSAQHIINAFTKSPRKNSIVFIKFLDEIKILNTTD